jgi:hypothetical protein
VEEFLRNNWIWILLIVFLFGYFVQALAAGTMAEVMVATVGAVEVGEKNLTWPCSIAGT